MKWKLLAKENILLLMKINNYKNKFMSEKMPEAIKLEMSQINERTGISKDFINQFSYLITLYDYKGIPMVQEHLRQRPFRARKYADVYARFNNVITDKNREAVAKLDELMLNLESILQDPEIIDEEAFKATINEAYSLIYDDNKGQI